MRRPVVLSNPGRWRDGDNPFLKLLFESLEPFAQIEHFTWRRAIFGRYDLLHVHWLEYMIRGSSVSAKITKRLLFVALLVRLVVVRTPSVWTVHNETPHDRADRVELLFIRLWGRIVSRKVVLTSTSSWAASKKSSLIPHGHYRPTLSVAPVEPVRSPGELRLLFFGHLRMYKGLEHLIELVGSVTSAPTATRVRLRIVGRPIAADYGVQLVELAGHYDGIEIVPEFLSDAAIEREIAEADCVILPYTRMQNSGAALLALSCQRPIMVPASPSMLELQNEVGPEWVITFAPPLTTEDLDRSVAALAHGGTTSAPDLSAREWPAIAAAYSDVYQSLVRRPRR